MVLTQDDLNLLCFYTLNFLNFSVVSVVASRIGAARVDTTFDLYI